jgi:hypothetical protein
MIRKQLGNWIIVCMNTFFSLDKSFCYQAYLSIVTAISTAKLLTFMTVMEFSLGLATVKDDALTIREILANTLNALENNSFYSALMQYVRELKQNFPDKYKLS